ncbi:MAG: hypothetical protein CM15mP40_11390 [Alphaproteobacteria bacterium]|nr:MAG: hypothetical protein CM15mP40_11390 [Alphaproteobacteria bacterium]
MRKKDIKRQLKLKKKGVTILGMKLKKEGAQKNQKFFFPQKFFYGTLNLNLNGNDLFGLEIIVIFVVIWWLVFPGGFFFFGIQKKGKIVGGK